MEGLALDLVDQLLSTVLWQCWLGYLTVKSSQKWLIVCRVGR